MKDLCNYCKNYIEYEDKCSLSHYSSQESDGGNVLSVCTYDDSLQDLFTPGRETFKIRQKNTALKELRSENHKLQKMYDFVRKEKSKTPTHEIKLEVSMWYWVKVNDGWMPAMYSLDAANNWTNTDTWEDFDKEVIDYMEMDNPI